MAQYSAYITGLDDALKCFDQAPKNLVKVVKTAMRAGGRQAAKEIRKAMPRRFKRLVTSKVVKGGVSGDWNALVGAFNKVKGLTTRWRVVVEERSYEITGIDPISRVSPLCHLTLHAVD